MESANTIQHKLRPSLLLELQNSYQHVLKLPLNPERNFDRVYFLRAKKILWRYLFKSSYKMTEEKFVQVFRVSNKCLFEVNLHENSHTSANSSGWGVTIFQKFPQTSANWAVSDDSPEFEWFKFCVKRKPHFCCSIIMDSFIAGN